MSSMNPRIIQRRPLNELLLFTCDPRFKDYRLNNSQNSSVIETMEECCLVLHEQTFDDTRRNIRCSLDRQLEETN